VAGLFPERETEAKAALEMLSSVSFVIISGAYFDAKTLESQALLSTLDAELAAGDLDILLQRVLEITTRTFQASMGVLLLRETDCPSLKVSAVAGILLELPEDFRIAPGNGFSGKIAGSGDPDMVLDTSVEIDGLTPLLRPHAKSLWGVPLKANGESIG